MTGSYACVPQAKKKQHLANSLPIVQNRILCCSGLPPQMGYLASSTASICCPLDCAAFGALSAGISVVVNVDTGCSFEMFLCREDFQSLAATAPNDTLFKKKLSIKGHLTAKSDEYDALVLQITATDSHQNPHTHFVECYQGDLNLLGLPALEVLGLSVDTQAKTLTPVTQFANIHFTVQGAQHGMSCVELGARQGKPDPNAFAPVLTEDSEAQRRCMMPEGVPDVRVQELLTMSRESFQQELRKLLCFMAPTCSCTQQHTRVSGDVYCTSCGRRFLFSTST